MNPTGAAYNDIIGIMEKVVRYDYTSIEIWKQIKAFFTFSKDSPKEIYENILIWMSKSVSDNPHLFFALASIPYSIFMLAALKKITSDEKFTNCFYCLLILFLFVLPRDIITVQNPRFTTGIWVSIFATISFFASDRHKWFFYILILLTPCLHSGFWFYVIAFTFGIVVMRFENLMLILFVVSIPFSFFTHDFLSSIYINNLPLPPSLIKWTQGYLSEESYEKFVLLKGKTGYYWISEGFDFLSKLAYLYMVYYLVKFRQDISGDKGLSNLYRYFIYFFALVNFIQFVPVLGYRFYWVIRILAIYLWFKEIYPRNSRVLFFVLFGCAWEIFNRYFYHGAVYTTVPLGIIYEPLPLLIGDFWGETGM
ncbi:MAG: EpsG family protein [Bacteroidales bacterium]|jgi:hypothetical protein|nr:EpsG family protein [Bacteroidales bacterium]